MSKRRLIPKLQLKTSAFNTKKFVLVITKQFDHIVEIGDPVSQAKIFQDQAADELIFVNIDRERNNIDLLADITLKLSQEIFMPLTVGGGVQTDQHFRTLLNSGADKISINSKAVKNPKFITESSEKYGSSTVVVSIDYKRYNTTNDDVCVYIDGGQTKTSLHPVEWAIEAERLGAGEILLTSIDHDGMRNGLDLDVTLRVSRAVKIPVISSGGCGLAKHFIDGFIMGKADAVASGSFFAHRDQNLMQTRSHIKNAGVDIRVHT